MVNTVTADNALKSFYLDAVKEQLDMKINPFLAQIEKTDSSVVGKDVRRLVKHGISGGIGAGTEVGNLPTAGSNNYCQFVAPLKNFYGTIEISDKAIRASATNEGAFVNLLNDEMENLVKSTAFNFGRMLYGDGSGCLGTVISADIGVYQVDKIKNFVEGMIVDFYSDLGVIIPSAKGRKILSVDRSAGKIYIEDPTSMTEVLSGCTVYIQGSKEQEITGLGAIFSDTGSLYGVTKSDNKWLKPYVKMNVGDIDENTIMKAIDTIEENSGSKVNFILCSWGVRRAIANYYAENRTILPTMEIEGGYKAISFNGIPVIADRFCPDGHLYLLNTDDFKVHQLCDWQWLEGEDGNVLKQVPGKPVYTATLVKYAELMCDKPCGQGVLKGIKEI